MGPMNYSSVTEILHLAIHLLCQMSPYTPYDLLVWVFISDCIFTTYTNTGEVHVPRVLLFNYNLDHQGDSQ